VYCALQSGSGSSTAVLRGTVELPIAIDAVAAVAVPAEDRVCVLGCNGAILGLRQVTNDQLYYILNICLFA
jgi:hypothetical protein